MTGRVPVRLFLRRYQLVGLILAGVLFGSAALFSRDSEFFSSRPRYPYRLALTFDDGPHAVHTDRLLEILRKKRVAATFFVVGSQAERYPVLLEAVHRGGHEIANHTFTHPNLTAIGPDDVRRELDDTRRIIERVTGRNCRYFRPPGGRYDAQTLAAAAPAGYDMVLWTVFPRDHSSPTPQEIHDRVMAAAADGGVVLLHSGVENTLAALPRIIDDLRARGFHFLTVSEMLQERLAADVRAAWFLPAGGAPLPAPPGYTAAVPEKNPA